ncbi:MAG: hypothetical protein NZ481_10155, partial [Candidatus Kapabacteria bacterium]|nr:hypothetical protein [Candidatus Kapabacteria bacterium]
LPANKRRALLTQALTTPHSPLATPYSPPADALLKLRILDPACGSGHFLLAAARTLGMQLARARSGEDEPAPEQVRHAI